MAQSIRYNEGMEAGLDRLEAGLDRLNELLDKGWSQTALAEALGYTTTHLWRWRRGEYPVPLVVALALETLAQRLPPRRGVKPAPPEITG